MFFWNSKLNTNTGRKCAACKIHRKAYLNETEIITESKPNELKTNHGGRKQMRLTMKGRRGILLKMIAHAGAIDYQAIRIYYSGYPKSYQNKDLYYLTTHGYISKENQRDKNKLSYFYLTDKGKKTVLGSDSESVWDCAIYLSGNAFTNRMPVRSKVDEEKVKRCISQSRVLAAMYHSRTTVFFMGKKDLYDNHDRIEECFNLINPDDGTASGIVGRMQAEQGDDYKEYTTIYDDYLRKEYRSQNVYYLAAEIKGKDNPLLRQSRALGCLQTPTAPYVIYDCGDRVMKWKRSAEEGMKHWISEAYRGMYKERYEGDSSFVKGLFLIKDYSIIERILSEEKSNRIFGNLTLLQMTYDKNYFAKIEELKYYQNLDLLINVYNRIAEIYKLQRDEDGEIMYKGKPALMGILFNINRFVSTRESYVFCLSSQKDIYELSGRRAIVIDEIAKEVEK